MQPKITGRCRAALLGVSAALAIGGAANAAPFQNGSFENGTDPGGYTTVFAVNSTAITGWTVAAGSVDYIGTYWQAADGSRSLDMNGGSAGTISQTFDTVAGTHYAVSFELAGNPDNPSSNVKVLTASAGTNTATYTFNTSSSTHTNMGWTAETFTFVATGNTTTLSFQGDPATGAYGPALDAVSVAAVPEPVSLLVLGSGLVGVGLVRRKRG